MLQGIGDGSSGFQFTALFILVWGGMATLSYNFVFCHATPV